MKISKILAITFALLMVSGVSASAQSIATTAYVSTAAPCVQLTVGLSRGKHDATTNGQVTQLQNFLHDNGYLSVSATGYFGPMTARAVAAFQREQHLTADGIVGLQTRAHIAAKGCAIAVPPSPMAAIIQSITPTQATVGSTITVSGTGFSSSSIVHFSIGAISTFSVNNTGTSLTFTVPSYIGPYCKPMMMCPAFVQLVNNGTYNISVENTAGTSNTMAVTVIGSPSPLQ